MNLKELAHARKASYLDTLETLVKLESPTGDKAANDGVASHLIEVLSADGWSCERIAKAEVGDQVIARFASEGAVKTLILCHFEEY